MRGWTGKTTGSSRGELGRAAQYLAEQRSVDQRRAVQRDQQVIARLQAQARGARRAARKRGSIATSVSIIVLPTKWMRSSAMPSARRLTTASSEWMNSMSANSSATMRLISSGIDAVEAAQPRLEVGERHTELRRHERRGERRVDVARHDHQVRVAPRSGRLERLHHLRGLDGV